MKVYMQFTLLCIVVILQGCVSAVIVGTAAVGTAAVATKTIIDPRTLGTQIDDSTLKARIANALTKDPQLKKKARITNTTYQGKVLLTGQVPTYELAELAKKIVIGVDGTTEIYNAIRQGQPVSLVRASIDTWITIKIRLQLWMINSMNSFKIKLTTENGEVFMLGMINHTEGQRAAEIVSKVNGVKRVNTAFNYSI